MSDFPETRKAMSALQQEQNDLEATIRRNNAMISEKLSKAMGVPITVEPSVEDILLAAAYEAREWLQIHSPGRALDALNTAINRVRTMKGQR